MSDKPIYEGHERRKSGWTLWREVYGTLLGTLPFVIMLIVWGSNVNQRLSMLEMDVAHNKAVMDADRSNTREERREQGGKLDRISVQIEVLQQQVARATAVPFKARPD